MSAPHPSDVAPYPSEAYQRALMVWIIERIRVWKDGYYNKDGSGVDDATYDLWWNNLLALEAKYPHLVVEGTPTGTVGAPFEALPPEPARLTLAEIRQRREQHRMTIERIRERLASRSS